MKDKENKQTPSLQTPENLKNWAVEAVDPPPGVSSFSVLNTRREGRTQRWNPQFDNEPPPETPVRRQSVSSSRGSPSPQKQEKDKEPENYENDKAETSDKTRKS